MSIPTHLSRGTRGQHGMRRVLRSQRRSERSGGEHTGHLHTHNLTREKLRLGFFLTLLILAVECTGGLLAHSLALLSDAGHVLTDAAALGLAWFAAAQAERPANARRTYGYHRVGILTALANGLTLVIIAIAITAEAYQRFLHPQSIHPGIVIISAAVAIVINLYIGFGLQKGDHENLNTRAATLHVFNDVGASGAGVVGAAVMALTAARSV